jgi:large subunit ribosomal protein L4e
MAGKRTTAESLGVGRGLARIPRVKGERYPRALTGALAPGTVGGRRAHPPVVEKKIRKKINKKERRLAIRSAIAATIMKEVIASRGHVIDKIKSLPVVVVDQLQKLKRAKEVREVLINLGVWPDVERAKRRIKVRPGKGKMRGRRLKRAKSALLVISKDEGIVKAASCQPGLDIVQVKDLNAELLAPGAQPGRLTIWTESALKQLDELFSD